VPPYRTILTITWLFGSNFRPITFLFFVQQLLMNKTQIIEQESSTASDFEFPCNYCFPRADAAPAQPQGRPGKHCVASTHERSMREVHPARVGAERPFRGQNCTGSASPRADAAPTQPQGHSWKHCVASAHGRSTPGSKNGRFWGGEATLRPFLHWQCQLGTVPYTVTKIR